MADVLDDLMLAAGSDVEEVKYVREHIPAVLQQKFDDEQIQYMLDVIDDYLENTDEDDDSELVVDDVAQYIVAQGKKDKFGEFVQDEVALVVDAFLDYIEIED